MRPHPQCYTCLKWGDCTRKPEVFGDCYGYDPIPEPEPCEAETRPMFEEV